MQAELLDLLDPALDVPLVQIELSDQPLRLVLQRWQLRQVLVDPVLVLLGFEVLLLSSLINELLQPFDIWSVPDLLHPVLPVQVLFLQRLVALEG